MEDNFVEKLDLDITLDSFYKNKQKLDYYKKKVDTKNLKIKELMTKLNQTEYKNDNGLVAKLITQKRESFNEDSLIARLKELGVEKPIKTIEVIDYEVLEDIIYNGELNASKISDCKQTKEILTLKVIEKKEG